ncbi:unnamed protein product, partial [Brassica oleracea]
MFPRRRQLILPLAYTHNNNNGGLWLSSEPNSLPFPSHPKYRSSTVAVGSKIFFIGAGSREPSSDLWILDTRSGNMTQGPSMSVPRVGRDAAVGVIDGKIYVIGGGGFHDEIEVEALAEHDGKLAVLYLYHRYENDSPITRGVWCELVSLHRAGHRICGTVDWSGIAALVRSPELNFLRSTLPKNSIHVCLEEEEDHDEDENHSSFHWFTLNEISTTAMTMEYGLVPNPTPFPPHPKYGSSTVAVGSKIFFIGGATEPSKDLWILDTRSGNMTQGPSMTVARKQRKAAVGVIDGKIYVIGGRHFSFSDGRFHEEVQVEVFDPKSETWELVGQERVHKVSRCSASVEGKVFMVEYKRTSVYNPREGKGERMVHMVSQRLERGRKDMLNDSAFTVCVVEDVLFAFFNRTGLMWFDTKLNVWRKLVGRDGKELLPFVLRAHAMVEYEGRLVVLCML